MIESSTKENKMDLTPLHSIYPELYGKEYTEIDMDARFESLIQEHKRQFGEDNPMLFSAAGRTEIAGNHTDHNLGKVIGGTVNLDTIAAVSLRNDNKVIVASEGFPEVVIDISDLEIKKEEENTTHALLRGIAATFKDKGLKIGGWQANTTTRVLKGSGLSSSAAIEVLCAEIFNSLFNDDVLTPIEIAKIGQRAENVYFGKPSGLLDQACCAQGGIIGVDFKDKENPVLTPLQVDFNAYGYSMIITDTRGSHADLTHEYAAIPPEMREVAAFFGKENLREVEFDDFLKNIEKLRITLKNDRALLRAYHFFTENKRVDMMLNELKRGDIESFLCNVEESGNSSFRFLQNVYPGSTPKEQGLSLAIAISEEILENDGAVRVHGGGFAGTVQAYVPEHLAERYIKQMEELFGEGCCTKIAIRKKPVCRIL